VLLICFMKCVSSTLDRIIGLVRVFVWDKMVLMLFNDCFSLLPLSS